jgi:RHS repeat-associated protein
MWGLDLSDTMQGAGGVGGLLAITETNTGTHFFGFDGNGNVAVLVGATNGTTTAHYEYDPFGNVLRVTSPMSLVNPFRFSTKYTDGETGLSYYGFRFYNAALGRWVSRDPLTEKGHLVLRQDAASQPIIPAFRVFGGTAPSVVRTRGGALPEQSNHQEPSRNVLSIYQFCHNDPLNRIDIDGRIDVPPAVIQFYIWQGGIGALSALLDWFEVKRQCESLAEEPHKEAFGQTVMSRLLTLANLPAILTHCPNGGAIYRHIWFDEKCNCKKEFVVICEGGGGA